MYESFRKADLMAEHFSKKIVLPIKNSDKYCIGLLAGTDFLSGLSTYSTYNLAVSGRYNEALLVGVGAVWALSGSVLLRIMYNAFEKD